MLIGTVFLFAQVGSPLPQPSTYSNAGANYFAGANDLIMLSSEGVIDGDSPFLAELTSGECKEITSTEESGTPYSLIEKRACVRRIPPGEQKCVAVRDVVTNKVAEKPLITYENDTEGYLVTHNSIRLGNSEIKLQDCSLSETYDVKFTVDNWEPKQIPSVPCLQLQMYHFREIILRDDPDGFSRDPDTDMINGIFRMKLPEGVDVTRIEIDVDRVIYGWMLRVRQSGGNTPYFYAHTVDGQRGYTQDKANSIPMGVGHYNGTPNPDSTAPTTPAIMYPLSGDGFQTDDNVFELVSSYFPTSAGNHIEEELNFRVKVYLSSPKVEIGQPYSKHLIKGTFLGDKTNYPKHGDLFLFGETKSVEIDKFDQDIYGIDRFVPANLDIKPKGITDYYQYTNKGAFCNKETFKASSGSLNIQGKLRGDPVNGYACFFETPCDSEDVHGLWVESEPGVCSFYTSVDSECPNGYGESLFSATKCVKQIGDPESCSVYSPINTTCSNEFLDGQSVTGLQIKDVCLYNGPKTQPNCPSGWSVSPDDPNVCIKHVEITPLCSDGYPSELLSDQCYSKPPSCAASFAPANFDFNVNTYGRGTNLWEYEVELGTDQGFEFEITGEMHEILVDQFIPDASTPDCQGVIDAYVADTFESDASCITNLGDVLVGGVEFNNHSAYGLLGSLTPWGTTYDEPLQNTCWKAELTVTPDVSLGLGGSPEGCQGFVGEAYSNCLENKYCTYDDLNGQDVCYELGGDTPGLMNTCAKLETNPRCSEIPEETVCEEYSIGDDGLRTCVYQSVTFECTSDDEGYSMPGNSSTDIVCGGVVNCMGGSCANIEEENNDDFAEAAVMLKVTDEMKQNADCKANPATCQLFGGEVGKCRQPSLPGADDCCDPDDMGMGGMDVIATLQAMKYMYDMTEEGTFVSMMGQAWTGVSGGLNAIGADGLVSASESGAQWLTLNSASFLAIVPALAQTK